MNIAIISGSSRPEGQSLKLSKWLLAKLQEKSASTELIDLHTVDLPMNVDLLKIKDQPELMAKWQPYRDMLDKADGFVIVSPEWNGMVPPALLNFLLYGSEGGKPFAHKPALLATVSSSRGGDYPVAELRSYGIKNNFLCYVPDHLVVRPIGKFFNSPQPVEGDKDDAFLQTKAQYLLDILLEYTKALQTVRQSGVIDLKTYPNGM